MAENYLRGRLRGEGIFFIGSCKRVGVFVLSYGFVVFFNSIGCVRLVLLVELLEGDGRVVLAGVDLVGWFRRR